MFSKRSFLFLYADDFLFLWLGHYLLYYSGKSSLLGALTETESEAAAYEFTTLTTIPGVLQ